MKIGTPWSTVRGKTMPRAELDAPLLDTLIFTRRIISEKKRKRMKKRKGKWKIIFLFIFFYFNRGVETILVSILTIARLRDSTNCLLRMRRKHYSFIPDRDSSEQPGAQPENPRVNWVRVVFKQKRERRLAASWVGGGCWVGSGASPLCSAFSFSSDAYFSSISTAPSASSSAPSSGGRYRRECVLPFPDPLRLCRAQWNRATTSLGFILSELDTDDLDQINLEIWSVE